LHLGDEGKWSHPVVKEGPWNDYGGLCPENMVTDGVCRIEKRTIVFTEDTKLEFDLVAVEMYGSSISCVLLDETACTIQIGFVDHQKMTRLRLRDKSSINARIIIIQSPNTELTIDGSSTLEADGRSLSSRGSDLDRK
jgi:hypothetical protein